MREEGAVVAGWRGKGWDPNKTTPKKCLLCPVCCVQSSGEDISPPLFMSESTKMKIADLSPQVESESARRKMENVSGIDYCDKIQVIMDDVKVKLHCKKTHFKK